MKEIADYTIHDLVKFRIRKSTSLIGKHFDTYTMQFQNFVSKDNSSNDFIVEIGPFCRRNGDCTILDDTYYIANDYIYFKDRRKLSKWEVEISGINDSPRVKIATNIVGNITTTLNIIEFLIHYSFLKKGVSIIHASGVSKSGKCVVFPARSGGGKTTIALSFLDRRFSYLGDNYIILDKGVARNYISPLNIFTYNRLPIIEKSLNRRRRLSMILKRTLYSVTGGYFKIFEKINPAEVFGDSIADDCAINLICHLDVRDMSPKEKLIPKPITRKNLVKRLRYNMELDMLSFSKYIYSYGYMFPNSVFSKFWEIYEKNLEHNLSKDIPTISIEVPSVWCENTTDSIVKLVNNHL